MRCKRGIQRKVKNFRHQGLKEILIKRYMRVRNYRTGVSLTVAVMAIAMALSVAGKENQIREKARYYYIQGSLEVANNNMAEAFEYFKKAYETDSTYRDASFTYGNQRLFVRTDTLQSPVELKRSLEMLQDYVDDNPRDLYAAQMYGYVTTALDTVEEAIRVYERTYELMPSETQLLQQLTDAYMRRMDGKGAIGALERYEAIEGKSSEVSLKKITVMLATKDTLGAIKEADSLIEFNPKDPYSRILKGNLYEVVGEMDSVVKAYKEAQALAPDNGAVKMSLANYYRATGDSVMLDNMMYEALLSEDIELQDKLGILGDYLQKLLDDEGDKTRGDHLFSVLRSQYPHEPDVLDMAARYAGAKGEYDIARETIGYAIDMDPTNERYWLMLLSFELTENRYKEAVNDYLKAREHVEPSLRLKNLYAASASMLEDMDEAEKILNDLLKETDQRLDRTTSTQEDRQNVRKSLDYDGLEWVSSLYCMLGDLYYKRGDLEKGFEEYENSLYFLNDNALTLNNYAYFLSEADRDLEKAKKMSRRALDLVENNPTYLDTYAWILYKLGEYQEAMDYMKYAMEIAESQGDENDEYKIHYEAIEKALENSNP